MALDDLGRPLGQLGDLVQLERRRADADHHAQLEPERARVHLGVVGGDQALLLEARKALGPGRLRHPHATTQVGEREPRVLLELVDQTQVGVVEAVLPLIHSHGTEDTFDLPYGKAQSGAKLLACPIASPRMPTSSSARSSTTSAPPSRCCCSRGWTCSASPGCGSPSPRSCSVCGGARGERWPGVTAAPCCWPWAACWRS